MLMPARSPAREVVRKNPVPPGSVQLTRPPPRWHQDLGGMTLPRDLPHDRIAAV